MPKEAFYTWSGSLPHRKIFELRWAKETDVDPAKTAVYLPPLPEETPDGVLEMIGNSGDTTEIDRLIAALKRAKRAMLGTSTGVDSVNDEIAAETWRKQYGFESAAPVTKDELSGEEYVKTISTDTWRKSNEFDAHNPAEVCPVSGCNCDLDFRFPESSKLPSLYDIVAAYENESPKNLGDRIAGARGGAERVLMLFKNAATKSVEYSVGWDSLHIEVGDTLPVEDSVRYLRGAPSSAKVKDSHGVTWVRGRSWDNIWVQEDARMTWSHSAELSSRGPLEVVYIPESK